jgi:transposase
MAAGGEVDSGQPGRDLGGTPGTGPAEAAGAGGVEHGLAGGRDAGGDAKKKSKRAAQANAQARATFQTQQPQLACNELIFLDEFGINLTMTRTYARAPRGQRAVVTEPCKQGPTFSVISALGVDGLCAPFLIEGALNSAVFTRSVEQLLVPCLHPGHQVWLDNVKFHSAPKAVAAIAATGARVCYLPTYSPDFNPLEAGISKIKEHLRTAKARTPRTLTTALAQALDSVTISDIRGWFTHCGYVFPLE